MDPTQAVRTTHRHFRVSKARIASRIPCEESVKHSTNSTSVALESRLSTVPRNTLAIGQTVRRVPRTSAPSSWNPRPCPRLSPVFIGHSLCYADVSRTSRGAPLRFLLILFLHSQQNRGAGDFPSRPFSFTFVNRQWEGNGRRSTRPRAERCRKISECLRKGDAIMADEEKKCCGEGCSRGCREGEASECHSESGCQCHAPKKGSCACGPDCHCEGCQEGKACTCHHE